MTNAVVVQCFNSIEQAVALAEPGNGLRVFATMARTAGAMIIKGMVPKQQAVDLLREIALSYGVLEDHGEPAVQAAIVAAIDKPFIREQFDREKPGGRSICTTTVNTLSRRQLRARSWLVPDLIPTGAPTIFNGDGGTGKSTIAEQLAGAVAARRTWLGRDVVGGRVLYLSCEDDLDELHRRAVDIAADLDVTLEEMADLMLAPMVGEDAIMAVQDGGSDVLKTTPRWVEFEALIADWRPILVVVDSLADVFAGREISRSQARQFVNLLRGLCVHHDTTVLLLAHPSLSGMASGSGSSGSTGWSNSVRSRLYLTRVTAKDDKQSIEPDTDRRILSTKKSNYAATGKEIALRWSAGVFKLDDGSASELAAAPRHALHDLVFIDILERYRRQGREVSAAPSANYAPKIFADDPAAKGLGKPALAGAMNRLLADGRIAIEEFGPPSKLRKRLIVVPT